MEKLINQTTKMIVETIFFLCIGSIAVAMPQHEPKRFENRISSYSEDGFLMIEIQTNRSPVEYSLYEVYLIRENEREDQIFNTSNVIVLSEDNIFRIKINKSLIKYEDYTIRVMLNNEKRARQEFYVS